MTIVHDEPAEKAITLSGYIPDPTQGGTVPAVSTWGLAVLGLLVLTVGSVLIGRRRVGA